MSTNSPNTLAQKLLLYGVSASTVSLAASAHAAVVTTYTGSLTGDTIYFDPSTGTVSATDANQPFSLTNTTATTVTGKFSTNPGTTKTTYTSTAATSATGSGIATKTTNPSGADNAQGQTIGNGTSFASSASVAEDPGFGNFGNFQPGTQGFLGLEFTINKQTDYGFAGLTYNGGFAANGVFTLTSLAYDPTGAPVVVPEPSTLALLVAGAAGAAVWRRRRQQAAA